MKKSNRSCQTTFERIAVLVLLLLAFTALAEARVITADVVALDQVMTWNRFGSYNPVGMMYALRRDRVSIREIGRSPSG